MATRNTRTETMALIGYYDPLGPITAEEQAAANAALAERRESAEPEEEQEPGDTLTCPNCGSEDLEPEDLVLTRSGTYCMCCLSGEVCDWCGRLSESLDEVYRGKHAGDQICPVCIKAMADAIDARAQKIKTEQWPAETKGTKR